MTSVVEAPQSTEPQSARGRARLARMLASATELFLRDGYDQTSIDAILELLGRLEGDSLRLLSDQRGSVPRRNRRRNGQQRAPRSRYRP